MGKGGNLHPPPLLQSSSSLPCDEAQIMVSIVTCPTEIRRLHALDFVDMYEFNKNYMLCSYWSPSARELLCFQKQSGPHSCWGAMTRRAMGQDVWPGRSRWPSAHSLPTPWCHPGLTENFMSSEILEILSFSLSPEILEMTTLIHLCESSWNPFLLCTRLLEHWTWM